MKHKMRTLKGIAGMAFMVRRLRMCKRVRRGTWVSPVVPASHKPTEYIYALSPGIRSFRSS